MKPGFAKMFFFKYTFLPAHAQSMRSNLNPPNYSKIKSASAARIANDPAAGIRSNRLQNFPGSLISGCFKWVRSVSFTCTR